MKTMTNKPILLLLALLILSSSLFSCSKAENRVKEIYVEDIAVQTDDKITEWSVITIDPEETLESMMANIDPKEPEPNETELQETEVRETEMQETEIRETEMQETEVHETEVPEITDPTETSPTEPTYINGILIANKTYPLPSDYNPGIDSTAQAALDEMFSAANKDGIYLYTISAFRTYDYQAGLYQRYVERSGKAEADRYSARPGHSEHQTGLAFDLNSLEQSFGSTAEGIWLKENCYKYGFIIRYPQDKEALTGYMYEPWHVRYLGIDKATEVTQSGLCLEEFLGITSVYSY